MRGGDPGVALTLLISRSFKLSAAAVGPVGLWATLLCCPRQAVLIVERWLLGRLRHRTFYSLAEVNAAIGELLTHLNEEHRIRRLGVTRRQLLEQIDRPALKSLPTKSTSSPNGGHAALASIITSRSPRSP